MTVVFLLDAAQTRTETACHLIFKRNFAFYAFPAGDCGNCFHHRHRTAAEYFVVRTFNRTVGCYKTLFSVCAVFGRSKNIAYGSEIIELKQILGRTCTKKKIGANVFLSQFRTKIEQGGDTDASTDQKNLFAGEIINAEATSEGQDHIYYFARGSRRKMTCSFAGFSNQQP